MNATGHRIEDTNAHVADTIDKTDADLTLDIEVGTTAWSPAQARV